MGGVKLGLKEEGIVPFGGVDGDVHGVHVGVFEVFDEFGLFFRIEAEVGVDGEDEEFVAGGLAAGEKVFGRVGISLEDSVVARPHVNDAEIGVGVETLGEFLPLMEHVALEGVTNLIPGKHFLLVHELASGAAFEGVEMDKGLVRDHTREREANARELGVVVVAAVEMLVVFDGENLLEEDEAVEDGGFESTGDRDDLSDAVRVSGGEGEGAEPTDRRADGGMEFCDAKVIEEREVGIDDVSDVEVGEGCSEAFSGFGIDAGRAGRAVAAAEVVGADDEEAVGVDCFAGANHFIPPAIVEFLGPVVGTLGGRGMVAGDVMGSGESVEDEDGVGLIVVQGAPCGVGELSRGYAAAFPESEVAEGEEGCLCFRHGKEQTLKWRF